MSNLNDFIKIKHKLAVKKSIYYTDYTFSLKNILKKYEKPLIWYFNEKHNNSISEDCHMYIELSELTPSFYIFYKKETEYFIDIGYFYELVYDDDDCETLEYDITEPIKLGKSNEINIVYKNLAKKLQYKFYLNVEYYILNNSESLNDIKFDCIYLYDNYIFQIKEQFVIATLVNDNSECVFSFKKHKLRLIKAIIELTEQEKEKETEKGKRNMKKKKKTTNTT